MKKKTIIAGACTGLAVIAVCGGIWLAGSNNAGRAAGNNRSEIYTQNGVVPSLPQDQLDDLPIYQMQDPKYIPAGYDLQAEDRQSKSKVLEYQNADGLHIKIEYEHKSQYVEAGKPLLTDGENVILYNIYDSFYTADDSQQRLYWDTGYIIYIITADTSVEKSEIVKMAESTLK